MNRLIALPFHFIGTLTADAAVRFQAPYNLQLVKVSAGCDNGTSFILDIGTASDTDAYLDAQTVTGAASSTTEFALSDFVNDQYPVISDGDEVVATIDYDGGAGTDATGVSLVLWFTY